MVYLPPQNKEKLEDAPKRIRVMPTKPFVENRASSGQRVSIIVTSAESPQKGGEFSSIAGMSEGGRGGEPQQQQQTGELQPGEGGGGGVPNSSFGSPSGSPSNRSVHWVDNKTLDEDIPYPYFQSALFCFGGENRFRLAMYALVCHSKFQAFILISIVINSILLAVDQPKFTNPEWLDMFLHYAEITFTSIFCFELVAKVFALGFILHPDSYLRSGWNILDMIIVITSVVSLSLPGNVGNYSALRVIRVLKPLRSVSRVKKLKLLIGGLFRALPMVFDNIIFLSFIMLLFAIAAVQFWVGGLNQRCYVSEFPANESQYDSVRNSTPFLVLDAEARNSVSRPCGGLNVCGNISGNVVTTCQVHEEKYFEKYMNYNNIGTAGFLLLKVIVLDNWPDNLADAMDISGRYSASIFYILLTLVGSYFCVNLFLAILTMGYANQAHRPHEKDAAHFNDSITRARNRMQDLVSEFMDCGVQVDFDKDVMNNVKKIGYLDEAYRERRREAELQETADQARLAKIAAEGGDLKAARMAIEARKQQEAQNNRRGSMASRGSFSRQHSTESNDYFHHTASSPKLHADGTLTGNKAGFMRTNAPLIASKKQQSKGAPGLGSSLKNSTNNSNPSSSLRSKSPGGGGQSRSGSAMGFNKGGGERDGNESSSKSGKSESGLEPRLGPRRVTFAFEEEEMQAVRSAHEKTPLEAEIPSPTTTSLSASGVVRNTNAASSAPGGAGPLERDNSEASGKFMSPAERKGTKTMFGGTSPQVSSLDSPEEGRGGGGNTGSGSASPTRFGESSLLSSSKQDISSFGPGTQKKQIASNSAYGTTTAEVPGVFSDENADSQDSSNPHSSPNTLSKRNVDDFDNLMSQIPYLKEEDGGALEVEEEGEEAANAGKGGGKASLSGLGQWEEGMDDEEDDSFSDSGLDSDDERDRKETTTFQELMEREGILGALAALEQTMDPIENDKRPRWKIKLGEFAESKPVGLFILFVSLLNVAVLSVDYYGIDPQLALALGATSVACTLCFAIQLSMKVVAWGFRATFAKSLNVFDLIMVLLSIPDVYFSNGQSSSFSVIRAFRMIRIVRILRNFESLQAITETILSSWSSVGYLSLLILLCLYIYAIMGMQLFGMTYGRVPYTIRYGYNNQVGHRENFDSLWEALLSCFIIVTGDNWTDMMLVAMRAGQEEEISAIIFFTSLYMIGNYILINLFVAIIIDKLAAKMEELEDNDDVIPTLILPAFDPNSSPAAGSVNTTSVATSAAASMFGGAASVNGLSPLGKKQSDSNKENSFSVTQGGFIDDIADKENTCSEKWIRVKRVLLFVKPLKVIEDSLYLFSPQNTFRRYLLTILGSNLFDWFITVCVFGSMMFLCFESAHNDPDTNDLLDRANWFFTGIFCIEMIMKIVAFGIWHPAAETDCSVMDPHVPAYFRDPWNWVDAVINVLQMLALKFEIFDSSRSLRTIRLTIRNDKTKLIIVAMLQAIPHVMQGLLFVSFLFFVLGIMGVQLFKGEYWSCTDPSLATRAECYGNFTTQIQGPIMLRNITQERYWARNPYHFDHLGASLLSLFVVSVGDGWTDIMFQGMDTTRPEHGPQKNSEPWMAIYFIIVYICCNFFSFNMIIGILINYFSKMKKLNDGSALLTPDQRLYVKARHTIDGIMFNDDLIPQDPAICQKLGKLLKYRGTGTSNNSSSSISLFEKGMLVVIVVNTLVIAATHKDMAQWEIVMIEWVNGVALVIFALEMVLKLIAYGVRQYLSVAWNRFDGGIVFLGIVAWGLDYSSLSFVRVLRVIKLVKGSRIERLLANVVRSFNSFINVLVLVILTFFVYAVAGVILWGPVKRNGVMDNVNNFDNVPNAMLVLYQIATTEGWADYMTACSLEPPYCQESGPPLPRAPNGDNCGNQAAATAFFLSFMVVCAFTILQLFVAVVVEIFTDDFNEDDPIVEGFTELKEIWTEHIGAGVNIVTLHQLVEVLPHFPIVLTDLSYQYTPGDMIRLLACLQIPIDSQYRCTYRDIVHALAWRKYHIDLRSIGSVVNDAFFNMISSAFVTSFTAAQGYAAERIQIKWRAHQQHIHEQNMVLVRMTRGDRKGGAGRGTANAEGGGRHGRRRSYALGVGARHTALKIELENSQQAGSSQQQHDLEGHYLTSPNIVLNRVDDEDEWYASKSHITGSHVGSEDNSHESSRNSPNNNGGAASPVMAMFAPQPLFLNFDDPVAPGGSAGAPGSGTTSKYGSPNGAATPVQKGEGGAFADSMQSGSDPTSCPNPLAGGPPKGAAKKRKGGSNNNSNASPENPASPFLQASNSKLQGSSGGRRNSNSISAGSGKYNLAKSSRRTRRKSSAAAAIAEFEDSVDRTRQSAAMSKHMTPQGATYVPGSSIFSFVPLVDNNRPQGGATVGGANFAASTLGGGGGMAESTFAPDPTGIFNPDWE